MQTRVRQAGVAGAALVFALTLGELPAGAAGAPLLVEADWLAPKLADRHVVVLHVGSRASYDKAHIPGARLISEEDVARPHDMARGDLMLELPEPAAIRHTLESLGISDDSAVVVYAAGETPLQSATRIVFTLNYVGLGAGTSLLNGGLASWQKAGLATTTAMAPPVAPGHLSERPVAPVVVDASFVQSLSGRAHHVLVDARAPVFYNGTEPTFGKRGHIPTAVNIPFSSISDASGRISLPDLKRTFDAAGIRPGDTIVAYCHVGQQATAVVLAARLLDIPVMLYDGAFQDWATRNRGAVEP
ncbi:MAG TPA: rhodanese-like domain-containing protein [Vicinamibacterales bacterium]|jgi:thiosulfate/3-mercaptopyruvate sulfurtransferase|nr:rhodanese-like domain-containing protein [Vicinamibacterales bacterium]